jgi:hypothetical protein
MREIVGLLGKEEFDFGTFSFVRLCKMEGEKPSRPQWCCENCLNSSKLELAHHVD